MSHRVHLIITVDYEVFGNGLGCVEHCVAASAKQMMDIADPLGAPLTFFVEATEFMAMQSAGVPTADRVRWQLAQLVLHGYDAQLHLHPQLENAPQKADGSWRVDNERWRIGDLLFEEILHLLKVDKTWLEGVLGESTPEYQCMAFRARGWCIQPSQQVVRALIECGFQIDSTVAPGVRNAARGERSDFRKAPVKPCWKTNGDVYNKTSSGLWEVPIVTGKIGRWRHFQAVKATLSAGEGGMTPGCQGDYHGPDGRLQVLCGKIGKMLRLRHVMLNFFTMPAGVMIEITRQWVRRFGEDESPIPSVAIAYTKNFTTASKRNMSEYLAWAKNEGMIFSTYGRCLEAIDG